MNEKEFNKILMKVSNLSGEDDFKHFVAMVGKMMDLLDDADDYDVFGTEGWRRQINWK